MMLSLREAYTRKKEIIQVQEKTNAMELLQYSHQLMLERLDTSTLTRIGTEMQNIENVIAPFSDKLPSLTTALSTAENQLKQLISGAAGADPKKMKDLLAKILTFSDRISTFLKQELPALLNTPQFKKMPGQQPVGPEWEKAFIQSLEPRDVGWFSKLIGSNNIPFIGNMLLARELTKMTPMELSNLAQSGKGVRPEVIKQTAQQVADDLPGIVAKGPEKVPAAQITPGPMVAPTVPQVDPNAPIVPPQAKFTPDREKEISNLVTDLVSQFIFNAADKSPTRAEIQQSAQALTAQIKKSLEKPA